MEQMFRCLNCDEKMEISNSSEHPDNCPLCGGRMKIDGYEEIEDNKIARFGWILVFSIIAILLLIEIWFAISIPRRGGVLGLNELLARLTIIGITSVGLFLTYRKIDSLKV